MSDIRGFVRTLLVICSFIGSTASVHAQVLVHEEPKHHPVLVNEKIRILDVVMAPGDSSIYHIHHTPSLFIFFTNSTTGSMLMGKQPAVGNTTAGNLLYEDLSAPNTRTHRVWNLSKDTFHVMDIELLSKQPVFRQSPLKDAMLDLDIDTAYVRAYKLGLDPEKGFEWKKTDRDLILVSFGRADLETNTGRVSLAPGGFIEISKGKSFRIRNRAALPAAFVLIELAGQNPR